MALDITKDGVRDPHNHKEKFERNKGNFNDVSKNDSVLIKLYLTDIKKGVNVTGVKGSRGYARLNNQRSRLPLIVRWIKENYDVGLTKISCNQATELFNEKLRKGEIKKQTGGIYQSPQDYCKSFRAFWKWYMKHMRKEHNKLIEDVTMDIDYSSNSKPKFHYVDFDNLKKLMDNAQPKYKDLMIFKFDSGVRSPTELLNIKVKDITKIKGSDKLMLNVRDETSKTFGRKFKLMLSSERISKRIEEMDLKGEDYLFNLNPVVANRYISRLGFKVLGIGEKVEDGDKGYHIKKGLTMYDFRHNSACYWINKYKNQNLLMYRFGWKSYKMVEYYTEFMGIKDDIGENDLLDTETKTHLEKQLEQQKQQIEMMMERLKSTEEQLSKTEMEKLIKKVGVAGIKKK